MGVTLPRGCTGRATATHDDGRPVEIQCYRFPDLYAAEGSAEWQLLQALRPVQARHPRLVIVPPGESEDGAPPTFRDFARAAWDTAENRPDLDPLSRSLDPDGLSGRELSSTLASLGLGRGPQPAAPAWDVLVGMRTGSSNSSVSSRSAFLDDPMTTRGICRRPPARPGTSWSGSPSFTVRDGDVIDVMPSTTELANAIAVKGAVVRQGTYSYEPGMRISRVIQSTERDLKGTADLEYALVIREVNSRRDIDVMQFNLGRAIRQPGSLDDLILQPRDQVLIFNADARDLLTRGGNTLHDGNVDGALAQKSQDVANRSVAVTDEQTGATVSRNARPTGASHVKRSL